ncbi:MAG: ABC transporter ATP-binding protein, partial [Lachnospiraceae bacterium]|nr:ABC transporter ATP-binding protein [Lachnospiraceae bacterium]
KAKTRQESQPAAKASRPERLDKSDEILAFENVGLCYKGSREEALTGISFRVKRNQVVGIIGGTGSGKSSLINLIPRFYDATAGKILVDGRPITEYPLLSLRSRIGVVPQKAVLFAGSIRDNMRWGNEDATDEEIWEALACAQAKDVVAAKDGQLDYKLSAGGKNLSGGQRQRLTIARALVKKPDILILDDSFSALDYATDRALRDALRELRDMTVVIVSQRTASIQSADQIIVLEDGEVAGIGSHSRLLKECEVYREIYDSQLGKGEHAS